MNKQLTEELQKPTVRKFKKKKSKITFCRQYFGCLAWSYTINQLINKFYKGVCFLLCAIDIFIKYAWIIPLENKRGITITNAFQKMLDESNLKPNKIWVHKGSEFYNRSMKSGF